LLVFGLAIAFCGSFAWAFLSEIFDQTLRTTAQVECELGVPVLASFPYRKRRRRARSKQAAATAESNGQAQPAGATVSRRYRALVGELLCGNGRGNGHAHAKAIGVYGCEATDSRSRVAAGLAVQAASLGADPVLLIDADERYRRVTRHFKINGSPGWRDVLAGVAEAGSCVHRRTSGKLAVMSPGAPNAPAETEKTVAEAPAQLAEIKSEYGMVVIDLPAPGALEPATSPGWLDEVVMVVEAERTRIRSARRAKELLERAGIRLRGVVLANRREYVPRWLYQRL
jgi:Mrp family chromosome partitioning ATPase